MDLNDFIFRDDRAEPLGAAQAEDAETSEASTAFVTPAKIGLAAVGGALLGMLSLPIIFLLFMFIGIPAEIGRGIGEGIAQREAKDFEKGCEASRLKCVRLLKDGAPVGEGYLLESSQTHIAFLDVSMQRVRVVLRENLELQPMRLPIVK